MPEMSWRDAIVRVLRSSPEAMHYTDVAQAIADQMLKTEVGATPAQSVNATISMSLKTEGDASPFIRVDRGQYWLRDRTQGQTGLPPVVEAEGADETGLINAFGMYWARANVSWRATPQILGRQPASSTTVDFCNQNGVYLLHDRRDVVYVGRTTDQPLGVRLQHHTQDRLNGRWERFSWFGVYPVAAGGSLDRTAVDAYDLSTLIVTMEALLIEGLEPPQNRRRGDGFRAVEFLQVEDPEIQKSQMIRLFDSLKTKL